MTTDKDVCERAREREDERQMTDKTEMMTDDLMKNWLAGRKEN